MKLHRQGYFILSNIDEQRMETDVFSPLIDNLSASSVIKSVANRIPFLEWNDLGFIGINIAHALKQMNSNFQSFEAIR